MRKNSATSSRRSDGSPIGSPATSAVPPTTRYARNERPLGEKTYDLSRRSAKYARLSFPRSCTSTVARSCASTVQGAALGGRSHSQSARNASAPTTSASARSILIEVLSVRYSSPSSSTTKRLIASETWTRGRTVVGSPGATNCPRARNSATNRRRCTVASSTSSPCARCATADAETSATASTQARCLRRASPRASQIVPTPRARTSVRAAAGTPGGSTPCTRSTRFAISGVRADTIDRSPAPAASHASTVGVAGRRTFFKVATISDGRR